MQTRKAARALNAKMVLTEITPMTEVEPGDEGMMLASYRDADGEAYFEVFDTGSAIKNHLRVVKAWMGDGEHRRKPAIRLLHGPENGVAVWAVTLFD